MLHRDIKPENLILEPTGNAKLMDFGIARPIDRMAPGQTQAGFIVGTPQYLAPEILKGQEADARADIYSCGIVLYEMFAGVLPFDGADGDGDHGQADAGGAGARRAPAGARSRRRWRRPSCAA